MATRLEWTGTATELLSRLEEIVGDRTIKGKNWPNSARALSGRLRRGATFLRKSGINVQFDRTNREKLITISGVPPGDDAKAGKFASPPSPPSPTAETRNLLSDVDVGANGEGETICVTPSKSGDADFMLTGPTATTKPLRDKGDDASDASDAKIPTSDRDKVALYGRLGHGEAPSGLCPTCGKGDFWRPSRAPAVWRCWFCSPPLGNWGVRDLDFAGVPDGA
jgi:hypothetical protein